MIEGHEKYETKIKKEKLTVTLIFVALLYFAVFVFNLLIFHFTFRMI